MRSEAPADTLTSALIQARSAVNARVFKAHTHSVGRDGGYKYVSHEDVLVHARHALLSWGLVLEQRTVEFDRELVIPTDRGPRAVWNWTGTFELMHVHGEVRGYRFSATTQPNDKGAYVASTSLDKVAHMRVLQLAGTNHENADSDWHDVAPGGVYEGQPLPPQNAPQAPQRGRPGNVVDLRRPGGQAAPQRPQGLSQQLEWSVGLKTFQLELEKVRAPDQLVAWWVKFKLGAGQKLEKGLVTECWQMFGHHVRGLKLDLRAIAAEIDKTLRQGGA